MFKDQGPAVAYHCANCNNERFWHLCKHSVWFTLFFVPVFPYENKRLLICPVCNNCVELDRNEAERLEPIAELNLALAKGEITEVEHRQKTQQIELHSNLKGNEHTE